MIGATSQSQALSRYSSARSTRHGTKSEVSFRQSFSLICTQSIAVFFCRHEAEERANAICGACKRSSCFCMRATLIVPIVAGLQDEILTAVDELLDAHLSDDERSDLVAYRQQALKHNAQMRDGVASSLFSRREMAAWRALQGEEAKAGGLCGSTL